ncbi:MAG: DUF998 domain-containing protein, partial [Candidatus Thorarchaeota archaeon]
EGTRIGPFLIVASGVFLVLTGIFQCDAGCIDVTTIGELHSFFATLAALVMIPVPLAIIPRIYSNHSWRSYVWFSWAVMILTSLFSLLYMFPDLQPFEGLLQRLAIAGPLIWMMITAVKILGEGNQ